jgi:DNA-binding NtrC family response regulator
MKNTILLISSDTEILQSATRILSSEYTLICARSAAEGHLLFNAHLLEIQMIIIDKKLSGKTADQWIEDTQKESTLPHTILIADETNPETLIESMKLGAMDIVHKDPFYESELLLAVKQGFEYDRMAHYLTRSQEHTKNQIIWQRIDSFLTLLRARRAEGKFILPSEMALYFPTQHTHSELPLDQVIEAIESGNTHTLIKNNLHRPRLLIVEDEEEGRHLLYREFGHDFEVVLADSCEDALKKLRPEPRIDVAILDIGLPGISGDDFIPILKEKYPDIQVVMLTAYGEYRLISKTINLGAGEYVKKPFDGELLKQRVFGLLQSSILNRTLATYMQANG